MSDLFVCESAHIFAIDGHHLVSFSEFGRCVIGRCVGRHSRYKDWTILVITTLDIEAKPSLVVRFHVNCNQMDGRRVVTQRRQSIGRRLGFTCLGAVFVDEWQ